MLRADMGRNKISGFYSKLTLIAHLHCQKLTVQDTGRAPRGKGQTCLQIKSLSATMLRLPSSDTAMHDKIAVTLQELLAIANHEFSQHEDHKQGSAISGVHKGTGTFRLEITWGSIIFESDDLKAFAQSLYDRYLLKH